MVCHITSIFLKAVFYKFYLVHSWILCPQWTFEEWFAKTFDPTRAIIAAVQPYGALENLALSGRI